MKRRISSVLARGCAGACAIAAAGATFSAYLLPDNVISLLQAMYWCT